MKPRIDSEQDLLFRISRGEEDMFLKLYDIYWEHLFFYVSGILKNKDDAEDIVQEVFVNVWEMRKKLSEVREMKSYLLTIARNMSLKKILSDKKKHDHIDSFIAFAIDTELSPEEEYSIKELSQYIDQEIDTLPSKMKEVFVLSREKNFSNKEIAEQLNISEHTVKKQINNSIRKIKSNLRYLLPFFVILIYS